jgi:hypothetical protein
MRSLVPSFLSSFLASFSAGLVPFALKGAVLLLCGLAAALLLRRAAGRHLVLSLAMAGLLALPLFAVMPSGWLPRWEIELRLDRAATGEIDPALAASGAQTPRAAGIQAADQGAGIADQTRRERGLPPGAERIALLVAVASLAALGWLAARWIGAWIAARRLLRTATPLRSPEWAALLAQESRRLGLTQRVRLVRIARDITPLTFGALRPLVLLPASSESWPTERRRMVLLHELAHVQRRDCLLQAIGQVACALHWFNPLAWLAQRLMRREREIAADDRVLATGVLPSAYAAQLLAVARGLGAGARLGGVAMAEPSRFAGRLRRILDPRADHRALGWRFQLAAGGVALALLLPLGALRGWAAQPGDSAAGQRASERLTEQAIAHFTKLLGQKPAAVELTVDPVAQALIEQELDALLKRYRPAGASIVALDPQTGAVLGLGSRGAAGRNLATEQAYEPASTLKVFTVAAALDAGAVQAAQSFACESGALSCAGTPIRDVTPAGTLSVEDILVKSSNVGAVKIYRALGKERLVSALSRLHFGERPPVQLPAGTGSAARTDWSEAQAETAALGHHLLATPLQVAAAFAAVANQGVYTAPTVTRRVLGPGGAVLWQHAPRPETVMRPATASAVLAMLEGVVQRDDGTGPNARISGYRVAGKTGTGERTGFFVGAVPASRPRLVLFVAVDTPQGVEPASGNVVAAPSFRRIAEQLLPRLGATPDAR